MPNSDHSNDGNACCIILARRGSKGIHKKNLRKVGGISIIGRSVRAGMKEKLVDVVYVSTDDAEVAQEARAFDARIIERPKYLANDQASSEAGWLHALAYIEGLHMQFQRLVFLQCTSPFTTGPYIDLCLETMAKQRADCAISVIEGYGFLRRENDSGDVVGVNHNETDSRIRRQDLGSQFRESGAIFCVNAFAFKRAKNRFCGSVALCNIDAPPIEIDTLQELNLCSQLAQTTERVEITPRKLAKIKAIVMDFDGVHTDNLVLIDQNGIEAVRTSRGDGLGLGQLRAADHWKLLILSKERNPTVIMRGKKLKIEVQNGIDDKRAALETWLSAHDLAWENLLYVGNDVNDLAAIKAVGLSTCPSDSHTQVLLEADWILPHKGGKGALRFMCDALLQHRAKL